MKVKAPILTFLFASIFTWLALQLKNLPFIPEGEERLIAWPTELKKWLNEKWGGHFYDRSFFENNFLIVNTTHDQEVTKNENDKITLNTAGTPITSRRKLADLLQLLYENDTLYKIVVCDVQFKLPSPDSKSDDKLKDYIGRLQMKHKIIFGEEFNNLNKYEGNVFGNIEFRNKGIVNKEPVEGYLLKYRVAYGDIHYKSLPLLMLERINMAVVKDIRGNKVHYVNSSGSHKMYNTFVPQILFNVEDFNNMKTENNSQLSLETAVCELGTLVSGDSSTILKTLLAKKGEKKNIFIGAISHDHADMHSTFYGTEDGSIILLNIYYNLLHGNNRYNFWKVLLTFAVFCFIFYRIFKEKKEIPKQEFTAWKFFKRAVAERIYWIILVFYTFILNLFFDDSTNLLALLILIEIIRGIKEIARHYRIEKKESSD